MAFSFEMNGETRVFGKLDELQRFPTNDATRVLNESGDLLVREFEQNFETEGQRLNEKKWQPLKPSTVKARIRAGYGASPILVNTGKLQKGFYKTVSTMMVRVTNRVDYYKYHQLGGKIIPQRTMIKPAKYLIDEITALFADAYRKILNG